MLRLLPARITAAAAAAGGAGPAAAGVGSRACGVGGNRGMATRKQRKRRRFPTVGPIEALSQASTLTEYRKLRGLQEHVPIPYFPEVYSAQPLFGAAKRGREELQAQLLALQAGEVAAHPGNSEWTVEAAVCFERYPRITPNRTQEEQAWDVFDENMHVEKSALMQVEADWTKAESDRAARVARGESDFGEEETKFVPASRETEADASNDMKSVNRKLAEKLFLVTKGGDAETAWRMPQVEVESGETLRQAAERGLRDVVPESTDVYFLGNAPSYCETDGKSKIFYYRAVLVDLDTTVNLDKYSDYQWLSIAEIADAAPEFAASDFLY